MARKIDMEKEDKEMTRLQEMIQNASLNQEQWARILKMAQEAAKTAQMNETFVEDESNKNKVEVQKKSDSRRDTIFTSTVMASQLILTKEGESGGAATKEKYSVTLPGKTEDVDTKILPTFSGNVGEYDAWKRTLMLMMAGLTEERKKGIFVRALKEAPLRMVAKMKAPTVESIWAMLDSYYQTKQTSDPVQRLRECKQKFGESLREYTARFGELTMDEDMITVSEETKIDIYRANMALNKLKQEVERWWAVRNKNEKVEWTAVKDYMIQGFARRDDEWHMERRKLGETPKVMAVTSTATAAGTKQDTSVMTEAKRRHYEQFGDNCLRCGRRGHWRKECQEKQDVDGNVIKGFTYRGKGQTRSSRGGSSGPNSPSKTVRRVEKIQAEDITENETVRIITTMSVNGRRIRVMLDSGADVSLLTKADFDSLPNKQPLVHTNVTVTAYGGRRIRVWGTTRIGIQLRKEVVYKQVYVTEGDCTIVGNDLLPRIKAVLDYMKRTVIIDGIEKPMARKETLKTEGEVIIPPRTARRIQLHCNESWTVGETVTVEPLQAKGKVLNTRIVCKIDVGEDGKRFVMAEIQNVDKERQLVIPRNSSVAILQKDEVVSGLLEEVADTVQRKETKEEVEELIEKKVRECEGDVGQKAQLRGLLRSFMDVFVQGLHQAGQAKTGIPMEIITDPSVAPYSAKDRRMSPDRQSAMEKLTRELLSDGMISETSSPYNFPVVLVKKPDGTWRFAIDYKKLNDVTRRDSYPLPNMEDMIDQLGGGNAWFTVLDAASGFWQIPLAEESKNKTAFRVKGMGQFKWNVMPMGLCNATAVFQRFMDATLAGVRGICALVYVDDIIIYSKSWEEHMEHLKQVLILLRGANMKIKMGKCKLATRQIKFLGRIITSEGVKPDPIKVEAIQRLRRPQSATEAIRFIQMVGWHRGFIKDFAKYEHVMRRAIDKNDGKLNWDEGCEKAFTHLKAALANNCMLAYPDYKKPFEVYTDASGTHVGAVLVQRDERNQGKVVEYISCILNVHEKNYSMAEKELLAVMFAVKKWEHYLAANKFIIWCDNSAAPEMLNKKEKSSRIIRWAHNLSPFQFEWRKIEGKKNVVADVMTRMVAGITVEESTYPWMDENRRRTEQEEDEGIVDMWVSQEEGRRRGRRLKRENGLIWAEMREKDKTWWAIVAPKLWRAELMDLAHGNVMAGHFGIERTLKRLTTHYVWDGIEDDVKKVVEDCITCQKRKKDTDRRKGTLEPITVMSEPWAMVGMDLVGPLPETKRGNKYVLNMMDYFTKYPVSVALKDKTADTVAEAIKEHLILRFGIPRIFISDQGSEFVNHVLRDLAHKLGVKHNITSPYHPQANGLIERYNQTMGDIIAKLAEKDKQWDEWVPHAAFAYATTKHKTTGETPYAMLFGREARTFLDGQGAKMEQKLATDYKYDLIERMSLVYQKVEEAIGAAQATMKERHDAKRGEHHIQLYDIVWVRVPNKQNKLEAEWEGPYWVKEARGPNTFLLKHVTNLEEIVRHCEHIRRVRGRQQERVEETGIRAPIEATEQTGRSDPKVLTEEKEQQQVRDRYRNKCANYANPKVRCTNPARGGDKGHYYCQRCYKGGLVPKDPAESMQYRKAVGYGTKEDMLDYGRWGSGRRKGVINSKD